MDARSLKFLHGLAQVSSRTASVGRVACNSTPATRLNVPTAKQARSAVVAVSIGFLRQFAAMRGTGPGTRFDACRTLLRSNDPAHIRGMSVPKLSFCHGPTEFC